MKVPPSPQGNKEKLHLQSAGVRFEPVMPTSECLNTTYSSSSADEGDAMMITCRYELRFVNPELAYHLCVSVKYKDLKKKFQIGLGGGKQGSNC